MRLVVVGAGFFGAVIAERVADGLNLPVTVIEKRSHIGGNCWSELDAETGIEVHRYGSHIFHTSNEEVWRYINCFAEFNRYRHRVLTTARSQIYPMPINRTTVNRFYGLDLPPDEIAGFIAAEAIKETISTPANLEEKAVSLVGRPLYEAFIKGYTLKQWDTDPKKLSADIITRLPVRNDDNDRYFSDTHEGIPLDGYAAMFERMLDHPRIEVRLNTDYFDVRGEFGDDTLVLFTGPIDRFFNEQHGRLDWRTIDFEKEVKFVPDAQGIAVMNYADEDVPYTRIHEYKHYHPERPAIEQTVTFKEYSRAAGAGDEPYYPVNTARNRELYARYQQDANALSQVVFGGRLGTYRYLDMDDTIAQALGCFQDTLEPLLKGQA
jgi:UDP-galactopyranose mutase